jgi:hypothetical protein
MARPYVWEVMGQLFGYDVSEAKKETDSLLSSFRRKRQKQRMTTICIGYKRSQREASDEFIKVGRTQN